MVGIVPEVIDRSCSNEWRGVGLRIVLVLRLRPSRIRGRGDQLMRLELRGEGSCRADVQAVVGISGERRSVEAISASTVIKTPSHPMQTRNSSRVLLTGTIVAGVAARGQRSGMTKTHREGTRSEKHPEKMRASMKRGRPVSKDSICERYEEHLHMPWPVEETA